MTTPCKNLIFPLPLTTMKTLDSWSWYYIPIRNFLGTYFKFFDNTRKWYPYTSRGTAQALQVLRSQLKIQWLELVESTELQEDG